MKYTYLTLAFCSILSVCLNGQTLEVDDKDQDVIMRHTSNSLYILECLRDGKGIDETNERLMNKVLSEAISQMLSDAKSLSGVKLLHSSVVMQSAISLNKNIAIRMILKDAAVGLTDDSITPYTCLCLKILMDHASQDLPRQQMTESLIKGRVDSLVIKGSSLELSYYFRALEESVKTLGLGVEQKKFIDGYLHISEKWEKDAYSINSILHSVVKAAELATPPK